MYKRRSKEPLFYSVYYPIQGSSSFPPNLGVCWFASLRAAQAFASATPGAGKVKVHRYTKKPAIAAARQRVRGGVNYG